MGTLDFRNSTETGSIICPGCDPEFHFSDSEDIHCTNRLIADDSEDDGDVWVLR
jgi:hypothetical protein